MLLWLCASPPAAAQLGESIPEYILCRRDHVLSALCSPSSSLQQHCNLQVSAIPKHYNVLLPLPPPLLPLPLLLLLLQATSLATRWE